MKRRNIVSVLFIMGLMFYSLWNTVKAIEAIANHGIYWINILTASLCFTAFTMRMRLFMDADDEVKSAHKVSNFDWR